LLNRIIISFRKKGRWFCLSRINLLYFSCCPRSSSPHSRNAIYYVAPWYI